MIVGVPSQLSVDNGDPVFAGKVLAVQEMVTFAGQVIDGPVLSSIVMTWMQVMKLPQSSSDRQVRVMVYAWLQDGNEAVTSVYVSEGEPSQLSLDVAVPVFAGSVLAEQEIVTFDGHVTDGGMSSVRTMPCTHVETLPQSSVALQVRVMEYSCGHEPLISESV